MHHIYFHLKCNSQKGLCHAAAQCAHAALGVVEDCKDRPEHAYAFEYWSSNGHPKIAVQSTELVICPISACFCFRPYATNSQLNFAHWRVHNIEVETPMQD